MTTDRRSGRTRGWLRSAFLELLLEQSFETITIQDITDRANTARVTFYRHYQDKHAILDDCLEAIYHDLVPHLESSSVLPLLTSHQPPPIERLYAHIDANQALYRALLSGSIAPRVRQRIQTYIAAAIMTTMRDTGVGEQVRVPLDMVAQYGAVSTLGMIVWWLDTDQPYPVAYLAQVTYWLGLIGMVGMMDAPLPVVAPDLTAPPARVLRKPKR